MATQEANTAISNLENYIQGVATNQSKQSEPLPLYVEAFKDALLIDLPVYFILSGGNPVVTATGFAGAFVGYSYRKYCNSYLEDKIDNDLFKAAICGIPGGALKYGIGGIGTLFKDGVNAYLPKLALGAYNNFMYEAKGPGKVCQSNVKCMFTNVISIEASEGVVQNFINLVTAKPFDFTPITGGINAGFLVAGNIYTTYDTFSGYIDYGYNYLAETLYPIQPPIEQNVCTLEDELKYNLEGLKTEL